MSLILPHMPLLYRCRTGKDAGADIASVSKAGLGFGQPDHGCLRNGVANAGWVRDEIKSSEEQSVRQYEITNQAVSRAEPRDPPLHLAVQIPDGIDVRHWCGQAPRRIVSIHMAAFCKGVYTCLVSSPRLSEFQTFCRHACHQVEITLDTSFSLFIYGNKVSRQKAGEAGSRPP